MQYLVVPWISIDGLILFQVAQRQAVISDAVSTVMELQSGEMTHLLLNRQPKNQVAVSGSVCGPGIRLTNTRPQLQTQKDYLITLQVDGFSSVRKSESQSALQTPSIPS